MPEKPSWTIVIDSRNQEDLTCKGPVMTAYYPKKSHFTFHMTEFSDRQKFAMQQSDLTDLTQTALSQRCGSVAQTTLSGYIC